MYDDRVVSPEASFLFQCDDDDDYPLLINVVLLCACITDDCKA